MRATTLRKRIWRGAATAVLFAAASLPAFAETPDTGGLAVAARISTLGLGLELVAPLSQRLNFRVAGAIGGLNYNDTQGDVDYKVDARLRTGAALLDWHPAGGGFRFSAGAMYNGNELEGEARPRTATEIGDIKFSPEEIGTLRAAVEFPALAGYVGIGFGNAAARGNRWTVLFDIGAMIHAAPEFTLSADGSKSGHPMFQRELDKERNRIESDYVRLARFFPVVSLGLGFRF